MEILIAFLDEWVPIIARLFVLACIVLLALALIGANYAFFRELEEDRHELERRKEVENETSRN